MRLCIAAAIAAAFAAPAFAQNEPAVVVPSPPAIVSGPLSPPQAPDAPVAPPPPGLVQTPAPPAAMPENSDDTPAIIPPAPTAPDAAPTAPNVWLPGKTAVLGVLNQVDGGTTEISIPVGGQATAGDLQVSVQACVSRPSAALPDAAIFLTVQSSANGSAPLYRGWMVRSMPGASVVGDGSETFRVIACS